MFTEQAPIGSSLGAKTTALEALAGRSLKGKTAIVTGGYAGLGLETVRVLAGAGVTVIAPARDRERAQAALHNIPHVEIEEIDLADPASIDGFAMRFLASNRPLNILINNAGVMACPLSRDARGYEMQFAVNHLGHYQLTARLWPSFSKGARIVALSSGAHRRADVDLYDPNFEDAEYDKWVAYGRSKTANSLFAVNLDAKGAAAGIRAFAVHPGGIMTDLQRHLPKEEMIAMGFVDAEGRVTERFKTVEQGAATTIWCATSRDLDDMGGVYCENCDIAELRAPDDSTMGGVRAYAVDRANAELLWQLSEEMTGVRFQR